MHGLHTGQRGTYHEASEQMIWPEGWAAGEARPPRIVSMSLPWGVVVSAQSPQRPTRPAGRRDPG
jgi:hypothetical protein